MRENLAPGGSWTTVGVPLQWVPSADRYLMVLKDSATRPVDSKEGCWYVRCPVSLHSI